MNYTYRCSDMNEAFTILYRGKTLSGEPVFKALCLYVMYAESANSLGNYPIVITRPCESAPIGGTLVRDFSKEL